MRFFKIFLGFIFLFIGSYLYLKFRSESLLMFSWAENLGLNFIINAVRNSYEGQNFYQMKILIYSLPYGLWVISFCCFIGAIWQNDRSISGIIWRIFVPVIAISSEILQMFGFLPGSFDINDLSVLIVSTIIGLAISLH